ncbi:two component, sigma54 specific, transcriptional regulator, Fis family [Desulfarculus baarsii DSM 2075]|uniref:Two component, sigma54 specific, transcriptional regulator, Fis family n=1 Tax=Desulfarculus baarsii (strain ATCC 33931 / DSM 2075 / LMG 7858 / VKM B-1802 / 2st14) TaxID=644282 RepID=E1QL16_DESB2|nr:sigma-54 dependent transcriptional regulator [Desulfarculus baarsii]ADK85281.1 two component, sigma54 specific, transcriptional regulator, Fis family [Desulfarculus baarsii DSM 2075]
MNRILVVDDEKNYLVVLEALLRGEGYDVRTADNGQAALRLADEDEPDLVITDMKMPRMSGIELIQALRVDHPDLPVIVMTAYGTVENAVEAMKLGATDYIIKPFENRELLLTTEKTLRMRRLMTQNRLLREELAGYGEIIGQSKPMRQVFALVDKVADAKATVLITGESGTGKELIARALHSRSSRAEEPFVAVNCMAITETLLESELFGHERGSFTGATERRKGRFELAHRGTLFLDEIGEISPTTQVKLLRVLQERTFERVGGNQPIAVDVRIVAATNRDLGAMVKKGAFREDLFYRLNVVRLDMPPLRERTDDLPLLVAHFVKKYAAEVGRQPPTVSAEAMQAIYRHPWPGNVRELENALERAVILAGGEITASDLPLEMQGGRGEKSVGPELPEGMSINDAVEDLEKRMIQRALGEAGGVAAHAAAALGLTKSNLAYKMKKYGLG